MIAEETRQPLVSCIMPTYNRRRFVGQAIKYFLRQDYAPRELIILDDGTDAIGDLIPKDDRIRYFRLNEKVTLGAKLNMACEYAQGEIIAHWDDDDWYAARRLNYQVRSILQDGTDLCGINNLLYYDLRTNLAYQYIYPSNQRVWLLGSTLCYKKELWAGNRFKDINVGMDGLFVWALPPERITVIKDSTFSVFMIHDHNVSPKKTEGPWWHPYPVKNIRQILDSDWNFYQPNYSTNSSDHYPVMKPASECQIKSSVAPLRNIFACLVHENQECVIDLVRNLRYHDSSSIILLYNGGKDLKLLDDRFHFERYGAVRHPSPQSTVWGRLHDFALDCMQFALDNFTFDTLTIVDSDQLAVRSDYSHYLRQFLSSQSIIGMLGNSPEPQHQTSKVAPVIQALKEIDLWRPFLRRFPQGEEKYVHWTFWPSTVLTIDLARDLVRVFASDKQLQHIMQHTKIWATEEIIIPTLAALLGYKIAVNPCSYDYVKYQVPYTMQQIEAAFSRPDVYWVHPIVRQYDNPFRNHIRTRFNHYEIAASSECNMTLFDSNGNPGLLLTKPILATMNEIEGWLEDDEADLLIAICQKALVELPEPKVVVEIGSYCGRSTVVLASVVKAICPEAGVFAIDPHEGKIGALDRGICLGPPTLGKFKRNIGKAGLTSFVETIQMHSTEVSWDKPISLLLIDALHDYPNVARDFFHFEPWVLNGGYIAFHDYADYYPGVKTFVNELLGSGQYIKVHCVRSLIVLQKKHTTKQSLDVKLHMQSSLEKECVVYQSS